VEDTGVEAQLTTHHMYDKLSENKFTTKIRCVSCSDLTRTLQMKSYWLSYCFSK